MTRRRAVNMPGDFDGCRFDFRIDSKKGLTPAARRPARNAVRGAGCSTLYSCKHCGVLCATRASLVEHKRSHRSAQPQQQQQQHRESRTRSQPDVTSSQSSLRYTSSSSTVVLDDGSALSRDSTLPGDVAHASAGTSNSTSSLTSYAIAQRGSQATSSEIRTDDHPSVIQRYICGLNRQHLGKGNGIGVATSASTQSGDVIEASCIGGSSTSTTTTKQFKCRQLNDTVDRLWKQKFKTMPEAEARLDRGSSSAASTPSNRNDGDQQLFVRRVTAAPGTQPQFYTSLMRLQSTRRKERHQSRRPSKSQKIIDSEDDIQQMEDHDHRVRSPDVAVIDKKQVAKIHDSATTTTTTATATLAASPAAASAAPSVLVSLDNGPNSNCQYVCDSNDCKRTFRELKHLKVHRMQHTNERPLACNICNYTCRQRNSLNWHMKARHGLDKHVTPDGRTVYG